MVHEYRKIPVIIQAIEWTGDNLESVKRFVGDDVIYYERRDGVGSMVYHPSPLGIHTAMLRGVLYIHTLEGIHEATVGDFIIRGVNGEFYPCKPDIFKKTYEMVGIEGDSLIP